jgi:hypothetical protein
MLAVDGGAERAATAALWKVERRQEREGRRWRTRTGIEERAESSALTRCNPMRCRAQVSDGRAPLRIGAPACANDAERAAADRSGCPKRGATRALMNGRLADPLPPFPPALCCVLCLCCFAARGCAA